VAALGVKRTEELMPADPHRALDPAPGLDLNGISSASLGGFASAFADVAYNRIEGSNNWVVNGRKSVTGKPLLANDPHRIITNPAVRYLTHLVAPGWNVIGAGEPASPGVAIGHNDRIAFGLTVVGMDQQDVYVEQLVPCRGAAPESLGCVQTAKGALPIRAITETVAVKGESARTLTLQFTSHGPIVAIDSAKKRAFAIRSVHSEPGTASYLGSLALDRARNWREFEAAMTKWLMPSENMIYADVEGNIGWIAAGLMPKRRWSGLLPVPGTGSHEWSGFVPGLKLPRSYNPSSGFINTSNDNILPPGYTTPISYEWATRYRGDRVREVLRESRTFSVADFGRLQHDDKALLAQALLPTLTGAAQRMQRMDDPRVKLLAAWDYRMSRDQVAPTVFSAWAPALFRRVMLREVPEPANIRTLLAARPEYDWLEAYIQKHQGSAALDSMALGALADVEPQLKALAPDGNPDALRWGAVHQARFRHPLSAQYDLPPASRSGDGNTVNATGGANFQQTAGASFREVIDLADFDRSIVTNVPGQSSDPRSSHYGDLLTLWGKDEYFPLVYSRARVEQETERVTWLLPMRRGR
jgi:penicillin amidase